MESTGVLLFCLSLALMTSVVYSGLPSCDLSTCPAVVETPGYTDAYCTAITSDLTCLATLKDDGDCQDNSDQTTITGRITTSTTEYKTYDCGVAGLAASTVLCAIVCIVSMVTRG